MKNIFAILFATTCILAGCSHNPASPVVPVVLPVDPVDEVLVSSRREQFRKATAGMAVRGIWFRPANFQNKMPAEQLANELRSLGCTRAYLCITSETELDDWLGEVAKAIGNAGMQCDVVADLHGFQHRKRGNQFLTWLLPASPDLVDLAQLLMEKEKNDENYAAINGFTAVMNPHLFNRANGNTSADVLYTWNDNTKQRSYENDALIKYAMSVASKLQKNDGTRLTLAIHNRFYQMVKAGALEVGTADDFIEACPQADQFIVMAEANKPGEIASRFAKESRLPKTGEKSVIVMIRLAEHTSVSAGRLRRRDWNDMTRAISHNAKMCCKNPAFGGITIGPYATIRAMLMEK
ncbi:MAG: hypothetical protein MJ025_06360 [Victivallaceae bacterium]|nr:hypothetical protein [Victivallaceae bacterium]